MPAKRSSTEPSHINAGDGVELTVTQARGGVRRGMTKVLATSMVLAVVAIGLVWFLAARPTRRPAGAHLAALASTPLQSRLTDQARLGADGLQKCSAFRQVLDHATALQRLGPGPMPSSQRVELDAELKTAKALPPASLTPERCGIPLG